MNEFITCLRLNCDNSIKKINVEYSKLHEELLGPLTFVGAIINLNIVAIANYDIPFTLPNVYCKELGFDDTSSDIILVETDTKGNPVSISAESMTDLFKNEKIIVENLVNKDFVTPK